MPGKLGYGLYLQSQQYADEAADSGATVVLLMDEALQHAGRIKARNPRIIVIGRNYLLESEQERIVLLPEAQRRPWMYDWGRRLAATYPAVDSWQAMNEMWGPGLWHILEGQVAAETAFTDGVVSAGRTSCVLNISTGAYPVPVEPTFGRFASTIAPLLSYRGVRFLGLHAYGSGEYRLLQAPQADTIWHSLRYRWLLQGLRGSGIAFPPVVITEYGQRYGWRPESHFGESGCIRDFIWFGERMDEDPDVLGGTNFLHGTVDPGLWHGYDTAGSDIMRQVGCWNKGQYPCPGTPPPVCDPGWRWDAALGRCVPISTPPPECPAGTYRDPNTGLCIPVARVPPPVMALVTLGLVAATGVAVYSVLRSAEEG